MFRRLNWVQLREMTLIAAPAAILGLAAFWIAIQFLAPAAPNTLAIGAASRGSPYYQTALRYREVLARSGVDLVIRETRGSLENLALLTDPSAPVGVGFVQEGLASAKDAPDLLSLGQVGFEPIWVFYHGGDQPRRLSDLAGKKVLIGPAGSGTAALATRLLKVSGVTAETATLLNMELPDYVDALGSGAADAGVLVLAAEARTIQRLIGLPNVHLMDLVQADAYVQRFPFLERVDLKEGVVDFARDMPPADTRMVETTTGLLIRGDLHPALASLLTQTAIEVHSQPVLNANGESALFQRAGMLPIAGDQEFPMSPDAVRAYRSGAPLLQRYLPFWLATWVDRWTVLLLPVLGVLLPALRLAPTAYSWRMRRRIIYWYRELKQVEDDGGDPADPEVIAARTREIERIERAVNRLPVPLAYADQVYDLRDHIDAVRRRLLETAPPIGRSA
ncbi:MAG: C4-dicarboxylate ABC transporter substrate-binding protein [Azospirillum sp.]|nr:C4-dicarboxylate ABC transporter substrate-binding protein [Azospirillum sp.]